MLSSQLSWRSRARNFDPAKEVQAAVALVSFASAAAANLGAAPACWSGWACSLADYGVEKE
jgi:hypothetical protein